MNRLRAVRLVATREILERGRSRGYLLALVFTVFILVAGFLLPILLVGDQSRVTLAVVRDRPAGLDAALTSIAQSADLTLDIQPVPDRAAAEAAVRDKTVAAALQVPPDLSGPGDLIVYDRPDDRLQAIANAAVIGLRAGGSAAVLQPPAVVALVPETEEHMSSLIVASAGIILMFIGIFTYGTWVLMGVVEEKQSRVVEVVLATVRPQDLLIGKVLGIGVLALSQLLILVAAGIIAAQLTGRLALPPTTVSGATQLVIWFILGFAFYSTALGALGALASRTDEAQNASLPVTMVATLSYILSLVLVTQEPDGILARVMTFFPPSAPMVVPLRTALDAIEPWEIGLSILIMLAAIWALFVIGGRVYSGAILRTGGRMRLRDAWRASR
jgi:ABC-2 type transport system permease protein